MNKNTNSAKENSVPVEESTYNIRRRVSGISSNPRGYTKSLSLSVACSPNHVLFSSERTFHAASFLAWKRWPLRLERRLVGNLRASKSGARLGFALALALRPVVE